MVNIVRLSGVTLATLINLALVAASEELFSLETAVWTANDTDLLQIPEEDIDYDYGSSIEERRKCPRTKKCIDSGGSCIKSKASCDGTEDLGGCKGKKCKCCIPYPATCPSCPTVPACPTISSTCTPCTTQAITTTAVSVPSGFEMFNGRVIRRTNSSDPKSIYNTSMIFCDQFGAKPFIPMKASDYQLYKDVRASLGQNGYMHLPADDRVQEGTLRWFNGDVATNISLWEWHQGKDYATNTNSSDCLFYGTGSGGPGTNTGGRIVHMVNCVSWTSYPPICEII